MTEHSPGVIPLLVVVLVLSSFLLAGLATKGRGGSEYTFGGRYIGRIGGGAAIASNWMSAASFLGLAGLIYLQGYQALAYVIGWTGGYVLLLVLMAGQIRRFGKYTAPEFVGDRFDSQSARVLAALISVTIAVIYCVAQFKGLGMLFAWLFATDYRSGVLFGALAVVSYLVVAGMLGVARNQQLQYFVLIVSFIVPIMVLGRKLGYFWVLPQFGYGEGMQDLYREFGVNMAAPLGSGGLFPWMALCFTLMLGTAGLPHVLSRYYIVPNVRDARWSLVWGLFFIALIYWSAPAYAVFLRLLEARGGSIPDPAAAVAGADLTVIRAVLAGGLSPWLVGIVAAGAASAIFSTVAGLLITGAASVSHDIYTRIVNRQASEATKMTVAKGSVLLLAAIVTFIALEPPGSIAEITAIAFALAGNTIFPAFLLGIWWGRANRHGVIAGMVTGIVITFASPLFGGMIPGLATVFPLTSSAFVGAPIVIAVMVLVSLITPPPPEEMRRFLAEQVHGYMD
jgi:cation/acetate symporter